MILTQCAVCATELGLSLGKKCGRCSTRYCGLNARCSTGKKAVHDQLCKNNKKAGGAEQYHANTKHTEAVRSRAEACAEDTRARRATSARRPSIGKRRRASCSERAAGRRALRTCRAWRWQRDLAAEAEEPTGWGKRGSQNEGDRGHGGCPGEHRLTKEPKPVRSVGQGRSYFGRPEADVDAVVTRLAALTLLGLLGMMQDTTETLNGARGRERPTRGAC